jgi:hypothetical protein
MVKTILLFLFAVLLGAILINRQRVFIRDPLATVYRNEMQQSGIQVFINYSDDILLEKDDEPGPYRTVLQNWNLMPGTPADLVCLRWMVCVTADDHAPATPLVRAGRDKYDSQAVMTSREISYTDTDGTKVRIELR